MRKGSQEKGNEGSRMGQERLSKEVGSADVLVQRDSVTTALPHSEARTLGSYSALSVGHWL